MDWMARISRINMKRVLILSIVGFVNVAFAQSEIASSGIRDLSSSGLHFEAVARAKATENLTLGEELATARSAWGLGLVDAARIHWDAALANRDFRGPERTREQLARAILELQEGNYETARALAEQTAGTLSPSDVRAQFWVVVAESLKAQNAFSQAETYYKKAVEESSRESKSEPLFLLGECQLKLGMVNDARYSFASVSAPSRYTAPALLRLTEIDSLQRNYEGVLIWVSEGRENYPSDFEEPWLGHAEVVALTELGRYEEARRALERVRVRHSDKQPWFALAEAELEARQAAAAIPVKANSEERAPND